MMRPLRKLRYRIALWRLRRLMWRTHRQVNGSLARAIESRLLDCQHITALNEAAIYVVNAALKLDRLAKAAGGKK